jgi:hypothetical protein
MAEEDDRWALEHLKDCDERESSFGVGTFRWKGEDGLVHRVTWSRLTRGWAKMCDNMGVPRKLLNTLDKPIDPGAVTCFACLGRGA